MASVELVRKPASVSPGILQTSFPGGTTLVDRPLSDRFLVGLDIPSGFILLHDLHNPAALSRCPVGELSAASTSLVTSLGNELLAYTSCTGEFICWSIDRVPIRVATSFSIAHLIPRGDTITNIHGLSSTRCLVIYSSGKVGVLTFDSGDPSVNELFDLYSTNKPQLWDRIFGSTEGRTEEGVLFVGGDGSSDTCPLVIITPEHIFSCVFNPGKGNTVWKQSIRDMAGGTCRIATSTNDYVILALENGRLDFYRKVNNTSRFVLISFTTEPPISCLHAVQQLDSVVVVAEGSCSRRFEISTTSSSSHDISSFPSDCLGMISSFSVLKVVRPFKQNESQISNRMIFPGVPEMSQGVGLQEVVTMLKHRTPSVVLLGALRIFQDGYGDTARELLNHFGIEYVQGGIDEVTQLITDMDLVDPRSFRQVNSLGLKRETLQSFHEFLTEYETPCSLESIKYGIQLVESALSIQNLLAPGIPRNVADAMLDGLEDRVKAYVGRGPSLLTLFLSRPTNLYAILNYDLGAEDMSTVNTLIQVILETFQYALSGDTIQGVLNSRLETCSGNWVEVARIGTLLYNLGFPGESLSAGTTLINESSDQPIIWEYLKSTSFPTLIGQYVIDFDAYSTLFDNDMCDAEICNEIFNLALDQKRYEIILRPELRMFVPEWLATKPAEQVWWYHILVNEDYFNIRRVLRDMPESLPLSLAVLSQHVSTQQGVGVELVQALEVSCIADELGCSGYGSYGIVAKGLEVFHNSGFHDLVKLLRVLAIGTDIDEDREYLEDIWVERVAEIWLLVLQASRLPTLTSFQVRDIEMLDAFLVIDWCFRSFHPQRFARVKEYVFEYLDVDVRNFAEALCVRSRQSNK